MRKGIHVLMMILLLLLLLLLLLPFLYLVSPDLLVLPSRSRQQLAFIHLQQVLLLLLLP
jgi:hypothetical protein